MHRLPLLKRQPCMHVWLQNVCATGQMNNFARMAKAISRDTGPKHTPAAAFNQLAVHIWSWDTVAAAHSQGAVGGVVLTMRSCGTKGSGMAWQGWALVVCQLCCSHPPRLSRGAHHLHR